jgi:hypothetical protein
MRCLPVRNLCDPFRPGRTHRVTTRRSSRVIQARDGRVRDRYGARLWRAHGFAIRCVCAARPGCVSAVPDRPGSLRDVPDGGGPFARRRGTAALRRGGIPGVPSVRVARGGIRAQRGRPRSRATTPPGKWRAVGACGTQRPCTGRALVCGLAGGLTSRRRRPQPPATAPARWDADGGYPRCGGGPNPPPRSDKGPSVAHRPRLSRLSSSPSASRRRSPR